MKTTTKKLAMTNSEYETMLFGFYMRWCESVTINNRQFQMVLANSGINAWFLMELAKCEAEFHQLTDRYIETATTLDMQTCYNSCTFGMFNLRPMALLERVKAKGSLAFQSNGIPVFNALNQN